MDFQFPRTICCRGSLKDLIEFHMLKIVKKVLILFPTQSSNLKSYQNLVGNIQDSLNLFRSFVQENLGSGLRPLKHMLKNVWAPCKRSLVKLS